VEASKSDNPMGLHVLLQGELKFTFTLMDVKLNIFHFFIVCSFTKCSLCIQTVPNVRREFLLTQEFGKQEILFSPATIMGKCVGNFLNRRTLARCISIRTELARVGSPLCSHMLVGYCLHFTGPRLAENWSSVRDCSLGELLDTSTAHGMLVLYESKGMCQEASTQLLKNKWVRKKLPGG
jgi:hypothetical protein